MESLTGAFLLFLLAPVYSLLSVDERESSYVLRQNWGVVFEKIGKAVDGGNAYTHMVVIPVFDKKWPGLAQTDCPLTGSDGKRICDSLNTIVAQKNKTLANLFGKFVSQTKLILDKIPQGVGNGQENLIDIRSAITNAHKSTEKPATTPAYTTTLPPTTPLPPLPSSTTADERSGTTHSTTTEESTASKRSGITHPPTTEIPPPVVLTDKPPDLSGQSVYSRPFCQSFAEGSLGPTFQPSVGNKIQRAIARGSKAPSWEQIKTINKALCYSAQFNEVLNEEVYETYNDFISLDVKREAELDAVDGVLMNVMQTGNTIKHLYNTYGSMANATAEELENFSADVTNDLFLVTLTLVRASLIDVSSEELENEGIKYGQALNDIVSGYVPKYFFPHSELEKVWTKISRNLRTRYKNRWVMALAHPTDIYELQNVVFTRTASEIIMAISFPIVEADKGLYTLYSVRVLPVPIQHNHDHYTLARNLPPYVALDEANNMYQLSAADRDLCWGTGYTTTCDSLGVIIKNNSCVRSILANDRREVNRTCVFDYHWGKLEPQQIKLGESGRYMFIIPDAETERCVLNKYDPDSGKITTKLLNITHSKYISITFACYTKLTCRSFATRYQLINCNNTETAVTVQYPFNLAAIDALAEDAKYVGQFNREVAAADRHGSSFLNVAPKYRLKTFNTARLYTGTSDAIRQIREEKMALSKIRIESGRSARYYRNKQIRIQARADAALVRASRLEKSTAKTREWLGSIKKKEYLLNNAFVTTAISLLACFFSAISLFYCCIEWRHKRRLRKGDY